MGLLTNLVSGGAASLAKGVADAIDRFVETDDEKRAAQILREKIQHDEGRWQAEINRVEAAHRSIFVAGWRPAIGWICAMGLGTHFVLSPLLVWITRIIGYDVVPPIMDVGTLMTLVMGMLGMGALRTVDKARGTSA